MKKYPALRSFLLFMLSILLAGSQLAVGQNVENKWLIGLGIPMVDFRVDDTYMEDLFSTEDLNRAILPQKWHLMYALNSSISLGTSLSVVKANITPHLSKTRHAMTDVDLLARYRFANGYLLKEKSVIDPYLFLGAGYHVFNITNSLNLKGGIGTNIWFSDNWGVNLQTSINRPSNSTNFIQHEAGLVIRFSRLSKGKKIDREEKKAIEWDLGFNSKKIQFEFNKAEIVPSSFVLLDNIATIMMNYPDLHFSIEGHTDNIGTEAFNMELSLRRAVAVKSYLIGKGIDGKRMSVKGHGETKPVAGNDTEEGRALNRRVEIIIIQ